MEHIDKYLIGAGLFLALEIVIVIGAIAYAVWSIKNEEKKYVSDEEN